MSEASLGKHAGGGHPHAGGPEPSYAERSRTLMHLGRAGNLSTLSRKQPGWPFGSLMPYALDSHGRPLFLISSMAMHTQNLAGDSRASLLVIEAAGDDDPLGAGRVTVLGNAAALDPAESAAVRELYLARHQNARYWVDFEDFAFHRLEVVEVYFVGGFGVMGWVSPQDYTQAEPDPLADHATRILAHMNADHRDALVTLARRFAGIDAEEATMNSVDRLGFHLRLKTAEGMRGARINFIREVRDTQQARAVLVEMVRDG